MRRRIAAFTVAVITASGLGMVSASPAAAAGPVGPRVIHINGGTLTTVESGQPNQTFGMSEFRVRGNSSDAWPKKPYGVVLSEDASLFGLPSGRTFRLQANYRDRSLLRNKVSFDLASQLSGLEWTPHTRFAELVLNGKYVGSYLIIEELETGGNRLQGANLIAEFAADAGVNNRDAGGLKSKPRFPEAGSGDLLRSVIANQVNPVYRDPGNWRNLIDGDSFVDYYLVREFTKDKDADFFFSNHYYSKPGDPKLYAGPVWDFDRSAGNEKGTTLTSVASPKGYWVRAHNKSAIDRRTHLPWHQNNWYNDLFRTDFRNAVCARWHQTAPVFANAAFGGVGAAVADLGGTAVANQDRAVWGRAKVERPPSRGKWIKEVRYLTKWYAKRFGWMNANICR
jgi:hypothetical protein